MKSKMNTWYKLGILTASIPVAWVILVKAVDVSRAPEEIRTLSNRVDEGFKNVDNQFRQVNSRLDYFIAIRVTNGTAVGKN